MSCIWDIGCPVATLPGSIFIMRCTSLFNLNNNIGLQRNNKKQPDLSYSWRLLRRVEYPCSHVFGLLSDSNYCRCFRRDLWTTLYNVHHQGWRVSRASVEEEKVYKQSSGLIYSSTLMEAISSSEMSDFLQTTCYYYTDDLKLKPVWRRGRIPPPWPCES
jgi:hypothetical protein